MENNNLVSRAQVNNGINSKDRVKETGEVFTPDSIVCEMLRLVTSELEDDTDKYIETTFLEPSCGDGQFLIRVLYDKLARVKLVEKEKRPIYLIKALQSIYGIDILEDNVKTAINRMKRLVVGEEISSFDLKNKTSTFKVDLEIEFTEQLLSKIDEVLVTNIQLGNTLEGTGKDNCELYIRKYEYNGDKVKVSDIPFKTIVEEIGKIEIGEFDIMDKYGKSSSSSESQLYGDDEEDW